MHNFSVRSYNPLCVSQVRCTEEPNAPFKLGLAIRCMAIGNIFGCTLLSDDNNPQFMLCNQITYQAVFNFLIL